MIVLPATHVFQFDAMKQYVDSGGNLFVMVSEGGETTLGTNINYLLEDYGVFANTGTI